MHVLIGEYLHVLVFAENRIIQNTEVKLHNIKWQKNSAAILEADHTI